MKYLFTLLILISGFSTIAQEANTDGGLPQPKFKGDIAQFIQDNLHYPADAKEKGIEGVVNVYCLIDEKGKLHDPLIIKSIFPSIDSEAMRLVNSMPDWKPARIRGKAIETNIKIQILFRL